MNSSLKQSFLEKFRLSFLGCVGGSVLLILGQVLIAPLPEKIDSEVTFDFPSEVKLSTWNLVNDSLSNSSQAPLPEAIRRYNFVQNELSLIAEIRYLNDGNIEKYLDSLNLVNQPEVHQQTKIGTYGLFSDADNAYLSACVNPWETSTFQARQYRQEQDSAGMRWDRLIPWLRGKAELRDSGCLWIQLSIPIENSDEKNIVEETYLILEEIWPFWYEWGLNNHPEF